MTVTARCDKRGNASVGTPMVANDQTRRVATGLIDGQPARNDAREKWCAGASLVTPYDWSGFAIQRRV